MERTRDRRAAGRGQKGARNAMSAGTETTGILEDVPEEERKAVPWVVRQHIRRRSLEEDKDDVPWAQEVTPTCSRGSLVTWTLDPGRDVLTFVSYAAANSGILQSKQCNNDDLTDSQLPQYTSPFHRVLKAH